MDTEHQRIWHGVSLDMTWSVNWYSLFRRELLADLWECVYLALVGGSLEDAHLYRSRLCVSRHAFTFVTWLIHMLYDLFIWDMSAQVTWCFHLRHESCICHMIPSSSTWVVHLSHEYALCDKYVRSVTWMCALSHACAHLFWCICDRKKEWKWHEWCICHMNVRSVT